MIALRGLSPMKRERYFTVAAFDTETEGLDGKLLLVQSYKEGDEDAKIYYNMKDFLNYIFSFDIKINSKIIWYAHNLEYDWRYLLDSFKDFSFVYKIEACESTQGKFFQFIIREKTTNKIVTRFRDSMALYPASLQNFTSQFAPKNMKQNIGLGDGIIFDYNNPKHINYAKNDVISLVHAIINFDTLLFEKFHVHVKGTTASTALTAWLRTISKDQFHRRICNSAEDFIRKNYYGGVVQLNVEPSKEYYDIHIFDINSSYPFVMKNGVPFGQPYYTEFYKFGYPGFYRVLISIPENEILPIIGKRNYKTLLWPCGTFETFISSVEIEYAKKLKYKIEIYEGYFFPKILDCFSNFVNQCEKLRNLYKNEATEIVVKLMQNSLYGKFGMRKEGREILIAYDDKPFEDGYSPYVNINTGNIEKNLWFKEIEKNSASMLPHYAAWITANARIGLDMITRAIGSSHCLYRDTDSIHVNNTVAILAKKFHGNKYGELKLEKILERVTYHGPKMYTSIASGDLDKTDIVVVYKGIPKSCIKKFTYLEKQQLYNGNIIDCKYHSSTSVRTYLKTGNKFIMRTRQSTNKNNIYGHIINPLTAKFRPVILTEVPK